MNSRGRLFTTGLSVAGGTVLQTSAKAGRAKMNKISAAITDILFIKPLPSLLFCNVMLFFSIGKIACLRYHLSEEYISFKSGRGDGYDLEKLA